MSIETSFLLITGFLMFGLFQSSIENLVLFIKFPAIINYRLDKGIVKSPLAKKLSFIFNYPGILVLSIFKLILIICILISLIMVKVHFLMPLGLLCIDIIGFFRWKFLPSSDVPMQRVILIALIIHYYFCSPEISSITLFAISAFLCLAYFTAGYKKLKTSNWTDGNFISSFDFKCFLPFSNRKVLLKWAAKSVIFFECSFFIALANTKLTVIYIIAGFLFHFYLYVKHQLSFFFWTFVAAYPAYYYTAEKVTFIIKNILE